MSGNYWQRRRAAFGHAFKGLGDLLYNHPHAKIHAVLSSLVLGLGLFFHFSQGEWLAVVICIGLVWSAEAFNTALEYLTDLVSPEYHPLAGKAKDMAAAAVLCASLAALVVGIVILLPKIWDLLNS
ncbi:MAG: diacylglycerol kinase family protein [Bacteroidota bacterium]